MADVGGVLLTVGAASGIAGLYVLALRGYAQTLTRRLPRPTRKNAKKASPTSSGVAQNKSSGPS
jgi:hypothetical protein